MSKILFQEPQLTHPLRHGIETEDGSVYIVDSCWTFDCGYESIVFKGSRKTHKILNSKKDLYVRHYDSGEDMVKGHTEICENLERYLH